MPRTGIEPVTFRSSVWRSTNWAIEASGKKKLFPECKYCGQQNSKEHAVNYCKYEKLVKWRKESWIKIEKVIKNSETINKFHLKGLLRTLNTLYFEIEDNWNIDKVLNVLKDIILNFYSRENY